MSNNLSCNNTLPTQKLLLYYKKHQIYSFPRFGNFRRTLLYVWLFWILPLTCENGRSKSPLLRRKSSEDVFDFPLTYLEEDGAMRSVDFPLSRLLRDRDFVIGQNARMSANQPLARIQALGRKPTESLFLSAVLDVILKGEL